MHISTVRIRSVETASGFIVINEADFDPSKHQFWNSEVTTATPEPSSAEPNANKPLDLMTLPRRTASPFPRRSPPRPTCWPMSSPPAEPAPAVTSPGSRKRNNPNGKDTAMTRTPRKKKRKGK